MKTTHVQAEAIDLTDRPAFTADELENSRRIFRALAREWNDEPRPSSQSAAAWNRRADYLQLRDLVAWLTYRTDEPPSNLTYITLLLGEDNTETRMLRHVIRNKIGDEQ